MIVDTNFSVALTQMRCRSMVFRAFGCQLLRSKEHNRCHRQGPQRGTLSLLHCRVRCITSFPKPLNPGACVFTKWQRVDRVSFVARARPFQLRC